MTDKPYLRAVLDRGREIVLLDSAARMLPGRRPAGKWIAAAALGLFSVLFPAVSAAQAACVIPV